MKDMILDSAEFTTTNQDELKAFFKEHEENAVWLSDEDDCRADRVRFQPIFAEPICVPAEVSKLAASKTVKFTASEEAYADTMFAPEEGYNGSSQMMYVNGQLYPVGESAVAGIIARGGEGARGWKNMKEGNPQDLSTSLNLHFKHTDGYLTVLVQDEKVRAVNSGRYAACPSSSVIQLMETWVNEKYPEASFVFGYVNHDYATWDLDMSKYTKTILNGFPTLEQNGFTPAVRFTLSHTGENSVSMQPALKLDKLIFPIGEGINITHVASGTFSERVVAMEQKVKENLDGIFVKMDELARKIEELRNVNVSNAYNALLRGMKALGIPKVQGMEAAEPFEAIFGQNATAYDIYLSIVDALVFVNRDFPNDYRKQFAVAKATERAAVSINWEKLGQIQGNFSW